MPKYRLLTKEELLQFEKEFIAYLVVNGITGDEWRQLKTQNPDKAEQITNLFSDVIFEKILRTTKYLTFISHKELFCFQCLDKELILIGIRVTKDSKIDFIKEIPTSFEGIKIFTKTKKYNKERSLELFDMLQNGCEIDNGKLFKTLCLAI